MADFWNFHKLQLGRCRSDHTMEENMCQVEINGPGRMHPGLKILDMVFTKGIPQGGGYGLSAQTY